MQQILQELQHGTHEVVKDNGDGTLEMRINPPSALQLRAVRLITQIINERDQVINSNQTLAKHLTQAQEEVETLKHQLKELNDRLDSSTISQAEPTTPNPSDRGIDPIGKDETPRSETS